ncbi:flagellar biosynthesis protein FlhF [Litorivivens sp.]|uniref:flagellar biosynthesis protein FlhF n=1 Tax=Litorivivens sp. TaxID=2020868 RepID=UPI00356793C0
MKVHTFIGADSTQAMRKVKESLGNDVTLLSCRRVNDGVELVVGVEAVATAPAQPRLVVPTHQQNSDDARRRLQGELAKTRTGLEQTARGTQWISESAKNPSGRQAIEFLKTLDIEPHIASALIKRLPENETGELQQELMHSLLRKAIRTLPTPGEGVTALVGPPGAGKTTTIAKIAADFVRRGYRNDIALITTDTHRIAAEEQLRIYGNIFQVPVHAASTATEAAELIKMLNHKKYLLIDTAGVGIRDDRGLAQLHDLFAVLPDIDVFLTLPADREHHVQREIVERFRQMPLNGVVATNLDQAVRLGALLSVLIQSRLPAVWYSDGPRVPEDIQCAEAKALISHAWRLGRDFNRRKPSDDREVYDRTGVVA